MSEGLATPTSLRLELEARRLHAAAPPRGLADLAPAMALSGLPQAFDLVIGILAVAFIFPTVLFPALPREAAILASFAAWSPAYAAGPVGRRLAASVRGRLGGGVAVTAARFALGAATAALGVLPALAAGHPGGVAAFVACRVAQGLAMGGVGDAGSPVQPFASGGAGGLWARAVRAAPMCLALPLATGIFAALGAFTSHADMLAWGWRFPFVLAVPLNVVALFAQLRLLTTAPCEGGAPRGTTLRLVSGGKPGATAPRT